MTRLCNNTVYNFGKIHPVLVYHIEVDIRDSSTYFDFKGMYVFKY